MKLFFFFFSSIALTSAIFVIYSTNTIYSAFFLILVFASSTGLLLISEVEFISIMLIIIYVGAITVLFLFVIMMFDLKKNQPESKSSLTKLAGSVVAGTLLVLFVALLRKNNLPAPSEVNFKSQTGMVETLGKILYTEYLLPFELISILFFVAMVGAVMLGKREAGERNF